MSLRRIIREFVKEHLSNEKIYSSICEVVSVNETERTCQLTPVNGDAERKGRIQASLSLSEGIYIKPVIGSKVLLTYINNQTGVITSYSEIESIQYDVTDLNIITGGKSISINDTEILFNGGSNGGIPITSDVVDRLNLIEQDINDLKTALSTWMVAAGDGGSALKIAAATWYGSSLDETSDSDIENEEVKH